jgi:hypothetical protein
MSSKTRKIPTATRSTLLCVQPKTAPKSSAWLRGTLVLLDIPKTISLISVLCSYKDKQALKQHGESAAFQKFQKDLSSQDLLLGPPTIHVLSQRGGFSSRL